MCRRSCIVRVGGSCCLRHDRADCRRGLQMSRCHATLLWSRSRRVLVAVVFAFVVVFVGSSGALAEGAWVVVASANTSSAEQNVLLGVTCVSSTECWAVGDHFNSALHLDQTLIEAWNGTAWSIVTSPNVPGAFQELRSVACVSSTECWAVGDVGSPPTALIEQWNGTAWSIVASPDPGDSNAELFRVTCISTSTCFAVGFHFNSSDLFGFPLIEEWNGSSWSAVHPPTPNASQGVLNGVTCVSRSRCWAVGTYFTGSTGASSTLVERWNGKTWSVVPSPNPSSAEESTLASVTCVSKAKCWAVGNTTELGGGNRNNTL